MNEHEFTMPAGFDAHAHLRAGEILKAVLPLTVRQFADAVIMPNLVPPVTAIEDATAYRAEIKSALVGTSGENRFTPLMTAYLTDNTDPDKLIKGFLNGVWVAAKLYPAGATTNSDKGVTDVRKLAAVFRIMQRADMPLLVHGELLALDGEEVDIFDRESAFIRYVLAPLRHEFPQLRIVFEHITTKQGVQYVLANEENGRLAATITPHHLWITSNDIFRGGMRPHLYCLPVAKGREHLTTLRDAAVSGKSCFFLGTDSAPHVVSIKESGCCPGGIFSANAALELYAEVFEEMGALDERFVAFASENGRKFYGLPEPEGTVTLVREEWKIKSPVYVSTEHGFEKIHPFLYDGDGIENATLRWKMKD